MCSSVDEPCSDANACTAGPVRHDFLLPNCWTDAQVWAAQGDKKIQRKSDGERTSQPPHRHSGGSYRSDRSNVKALTVRGLVQPIRNDEKKSIIMKELFDRHPQLREFAGHPEIDVVEVKTLSFELLEGVSQAYYIEVA